MTAQGRLVARANRIYRVPQSAVDHFRTDDLWSWGKPAGWGGPWWRSTVHKGEASDPYLVTGYGNKMVHCSTDKATVIDIEIDFTGTGEWKRYERLQTGAEGYARHIFPTGFSAHWVRFVPQNDCQATAVLFYT